MKKELMVALLVIGFLFAGVLSASATAINWTIVETAGMAGKSPGADNLLGTADDGSSKCNYSDATGCLATGAPTSGSYSFAKLSFVQNSSCVLAGTGANPGDPCTDNASCAPGGGLGVCVDCNTGTGKTGLTYFAKNPSGGSKGAGNYIVDACENGFTFTSVNIGTSEVLTASGGSCMTLISGTDTSSGCGVGPASTEYDLKLWTSTLGSCGFSAGTMPGLALAGQIYDAGVSAPAGICNYSAGQIDGLIAGAGLGSGSYLSVMCGNGTLPTDLQSSCLPGAAWSSVVVAKTSTDVPGACSSACSSGGCMAGTAEGVE